jgi:hypothetical protein
MHHPKRKLHDLSKVLRILALGGLLVLIGAAPTLAQTGPPLWQRGKAPATLKIDKEVVRGITVQINVMRLRSTDNARFSLLMPDGRNVNVTKSWERRTPRGLSWHGRIVNEPTSSVNLAVVNETVVGSILSGKGQSFRLRRDPSGVHVIEEIDLRGLPPEDEPTPVPGRRGDKANDPAEDTCATDGQDSIDVMVVYTQAARAATGGKDAIEADIYLAVEQTNQAYINSHINQRLRLVHVAEVSYVESGNRITDLNRLKAQGDGFLDDVHTLRNSHAADIAALIVDNLDRCGRAFVMETVGNAFEDSAFAVIKRSCATAAGQYSFAHEIAHVMSARHDWGNDNTDNAPFTYNHGHVQLAPTTPGIAPWRTIMAYPTGCPMTGCARVLNFSNPNISVGGDPTGIATGAQQQDNQRALNETALTVANFRCSSPGREDVWMKDTWIDTGQEPDPAQAALDMWQSPYIWSRNAQDTLLIKQHEHQNPINGQQNFVYVKVHNGGVATSGNLELWFANASVGLSWSMDWTLIQSVPVPSFAAHSTKIVEIAWTPSVADSLCVPPLPPECHYCLVARWVSSTDAMATPEGSDINLNVRRNNNIVWRNVNIIDLGDDSDADAIFLVQNAAATAKEGNLFLEVRPAVSRRDVLPFPTFLDFGTIVLKLDDRLMGAWKYSNFAGTGFKRDGSVVVVTDKKGAKLALGRLDTKFKAPVKISFARPKSDKFPRDEFAMRVLLTDGGNKIFGGIAYQIRTRKGS